MNRGSNSVIFRPPLAAAADPASLSSSSRAISSATVHEPSHVSPVTGSISAMRQPSPLWPLCCPPLRATPKYVHASSSSCSKLRPVVTRNSVSSDVFGYATAVARTSCASCESYSWAATRARASRSSSSAAARRRALTSATTPSSASPRYARSSASCSRVWFRRFDARVSWSVSVAFSSAISARSFSSSAFRFASSAVSRPRRSSVAAVRDVTSASRSAARERRVSSEVEVEPLPRVELEAAASATRCLSRVLRASAAAARSASIV